MQAMEALAGHCASELREVHTRLHRPAAGEAVDASPGSSSYRLALAEEMVQRLALRPMGEYQLGWVDGVVGPPSDDAQLPPKLSLPDAGTPDVSEGGIFIGDACLP